MTAIAAAVDAVGSAAEQEWDDIATATPALATTARRYLDQIAVSLRPASVVVADGTLRLFCRYLNQAHPAWSASPRSAAPRSRGSRRTWPSASLPRAL